MLVPASRGRVMLPTLHPWTEQMAALDFSQVGGPNSGAWVLANYAQFYPIYLSEPFTVSKAFWANGTTPGSGDAYDVGVYQMTDMATGRCDLLRSTGPVYSGFGGSVVQEAGWPQCVVRNVTSGNSSTDATSYTTATVALSAGKMYILSVENSKAALADAVSSIDNGPTFTSRSTTAFNTTANRVSIWTAAPTVNYTGTLVINFGVATETGCVWSLEEVSGVDTGTADGMVQQVTATGNSVTPSVTLAAFGSAYNATYFACSNVADTTTTPKAGFQELVDISAATPLQTLETQWAAQNDTTPSGTITAGEWGACGIEIKAASAPATPWRIAQALLLNVLDATDLATYTTASVTLKAGRLYLLSVGNSHGSAATAVSSVTGGPTWTNRQSVLSNASLNRTTLLSAVPTSDYTGTLAIAFGGTTQTSASWVLVEMSGVDTTTDDGLVQGATNSGSSVTPNVSLAAFGDARNATFAVFANPSDSTVTPAIGWTELSDTPGGGGLFLETQWRVDNARLAYGTISSAAWGGIAVEIKCDTSPFIIPASLPGNPNVYMAFAGSLALAGILVRQASTVAIATAGGQLGKTSAFPLPSTVIPVTLTTRMTPLAGFSSRSLIG